MKNGKKMKEIKRKITKNAIMLAIILSTTVSLFSIKTYGSGKNKIEDTVKVVKDTSDSTSKSAVSENSIVEIDTTPTTTNDFIMVGGDWVTPTAMNGQYVNVVLPVVNMSKINLKDVIITPVVASNTNEWPFEIQTSGYTQTIPDLPGKGNGQNDMDRRRELTWTFKVRSDVLNGYYKLPFDVIYYNGSTYEKATLTTWVRAVGAPGAGNLTTTGAQTSTPRVIITGFDTYPKDVYAGDTFTLTLHLKNTSNRTAISNMQVDLSTPSGGKDNETASEAFLPTSGSNTLYIDRIGANSIADLSIEMTAKADLVQKPYAIAVNMVYEDSLYATFNASANVSIPVKQDARFELSAIEVMPQDITVGNETNVMFSIYNTGKTTMYNVQVKFKADSVSGGDTFLGKIESGGTGSVDAMVKGANPTTDDGVVKAIITYEDEAGNSYTDEGTFNLSVSEEYYEEMDMGDYVPEEPQKNVKPIVIVIVVLVVVIIAIVVTVVVIKKKKKKKEQSELEDLIDDEDEADDEQSEKDDELKE